MNRFESARRAALRVGACRAWGAWLAAGASGGAEAAPAGAAAPSPESAADPSRAAAQCVIPAKAGGGFELTCGLARDALQSVRPQAPPLTARYLPGGIGALAFDRIATGQTGGDGTLVAFSSGSLLNMAQGRFGPHGTSSVHWLAALGADYGVVAVTQQSPYRNLQDLLLALRQDMGRVVFGAGGTVGSQDWVKAALLVRAAGRDHKAMRFVSFEGGGEALVALRGGHVGVFTGDAAEALGSAGAPVRYLAVLADARLPGALARAPTAREQGVDLVWRTVRGLYLSAQVSREATDAWRRAFDEALRSPHYPALLARHGLHPFSLTGAALDRFVDGALADYRLLATELGLPTWRR